MAISLNACVCGTCARRCTPLRSCASGCPARVRRVCLAVPAPTACGACPRPRPRPRPLSGGRAVLVRVR
eukprot:1319206-Alexandrium_andersonii.AAC.1